MVRDRQSGHSKENGNANSLPTNGHAVELEEVKYTLQDDHGANVGQNGLTGKGQAKDNAYVEIKTSQDKSKKKSRTHPSPFRAIVRAFGPYFLIGGLYKLLFDAISFLGPFLLG